MLKLRFKINNQSFQKDINEFPFTIGRSKDSDLILEDDSVSSNHLTINIDENKSIFIIDNKSTNGTYLDEKKIDNKSTILESTNVYLGEFKIFFELSNYQLEKTRVIKVPKQMLKKNFIDQYGVYLSLPIFLIFSTFFDILTDFSAFNYYKSFSNNFFSNLFEYVLTILLMILIPIIFLRLINKKIYLKPIIKIVLYFNLSVFIFEKVFNYIAFIFHTGKTFFVFQELFILNLFILVVYSFFREFARQKHTDLIVKVFKGLALISSLSVLYYYYGDDENPFNTNFHSKITYPIVSIKNTQGMEILTKKLDKSLKILESNRKSRIKLRKENP